MKRIALVLLVAGCAGGDPGNKKLPEECRGATPVTLEVVPRRIRVGAATLLAASGGSGVYRFTVEAGGSGGQVMGERFIAGMKPATDTLFAEDAVCGGDKAMATVEVLGAFQVAPLKGTVKPRTAFKIETQGTLGPATFILAQNGSGGSLTAAGSYVAGAKDGVDLITVRDTATGDDLLVELRVATDARFRASPDRLALPAGSSLPLITIDGTDGIVWTRTAGKGTIATRPNKPALLTVEADATGLIELEAKDRFTGLVTKARARVLDELQRPVTAYGRLGDTAAVATGDFDGDGIPDLAVGIPDSDIGRPRGGAVLIFKGGPKGLGGDPWHVLPGTSDTAQFGAALGVGDLDGDGHDDLAVAAPGADVTIGDSGAVELYKFGPDGPRTLRSPLTGIGRGSFGAALVIADVDGDGNKDVVVGSPGADLAPTAQISRRGVVDVFLIKKGVSIPDLGGIRLGGVDLQPDGNLVARSNTAAGRALAVDDLDGDGKADMAILTSVTNALGMTRSQTAVQLHFSKGGTRPYGETPDAFVLPSDPAEMTEGTYRIAIIPGRPALLAIFADLADSPDLVASGGTGAAVNAGGVQLFDVSGLKHVGEAPPKPPQIGRDKALARFYGDVANAAAGRSFAIVDGEDGARDLLLGAPLALARGAAAGTPPAGKILRFPLAGLKAGTVSNRAAEQRFGMAGDALGAGLGIWPLVGGPQLVAVAGRANTTRGKFTGRVDAFARQKGALDSWPVVSAEVPARAAGELFGLAVAADVSAGKTVALVGSPGFSSVRPTLDGTDVGLGRAVTFDLAAPTAPRVSVEGGTSPLTKGGRGLASDVALTDFDGDGRADLVIAAPNLQVPSVAQRATEVAPLYASEAPGCIASAVQSTGGMLVQLGRADGSFAPAFRLWAPTEIAGCTPATDARCRRSGLGRGIVGGFDFNGDKKQDVATLRANGLEIFLGRAPEDPSLAKLTMVCDPAMSLPALTPSNSSAVAAVGDLDGDGCHEVALRYTPDGTRGGVMVVFGFDPGGACGPGHTVPASLRIAADPDVSSPAFGLGIATARAGKVLADNRDYLAVSASRYPLQGIAQPTVLLFDTAIIASLRPPMGDVVTAAIGDRLTPLPLAHRERLQGFGTAIVGNVDVTGDGKPDLVVSAPGGSLAGDGEGAVMVFAGGFRGDTLPDPALIIGGDVRERGLFGQRLALTRGAAPVLVIGAPSSYRTGTQNGTAFALPLRF